MHLLLVEDDAGLARALTRLLVDERHVVDVARTGREGLELALDDRGLDAVILDVRLPDLDGLQVCRAVRRLGSELPVLVLTARDTVADRVAGLDAGADDYLVKPFAYAELSARLRALVRRSTAPVGSEGRLDAGGIGLDEVARQARVGVDTIDLSRREFALLECFLRHPNQVLTRDQLLDHVWPLAAAVTPNRGRAVIGARKCRHGSAYGMSDGLEVPRTRPRASP